MAAVDLITTHGPWILLVAFTIASIVSETGLYMTLYVVPGIILYAGTFLALKIGRGIPPRDTMRVPCDTQTGFWGMVPGITNIPNLPFSIILSSLISAAAGTYWGLRKAGGDRDALTKMAGQLALGLAFWLADVISLAMHLGGCYETAMGGAGGAIASLNAASNVGVIMYATLLGAGLGAFAGWANSAARKGSDDSPTTTCSKEGTARRFRCRVRQEKL
jgi:hypothetical protein